MNIVQPVRDLEKLEAMKAFLRRRSYRDYMLFVFGINNGLRVSDLLGLFVGNVRDERGTIRQHISVTQKKTGKAVRFKLVPAVREELATYTVGMPDNSPLFPSRKGGQAITRVQAWRVLNDAADNVGLDEVGTHTLRKTFGYHAYKHTGDVAKVQQMLGQKSIASTQHYIGITDDEIEKAMEGFGL